VGELEEPDECVLRDLFRAIPVPGERGEKANQGRYVAPRAC
jgi:hypothetical protein